MMNRKETTKFLSELLITHRFSGIGKYWASEVTLDYGWKDGGKRIDFMQFVPENQMSVSGLEKGIFVCYEVKSCKSDFNSGYGLNFIGEKNYIVTTMKAYKEIIKETHIPSPVGVIVACPKFRNLTDEFENPTPLENEEMWTLKVIQNSMCQPRKRSMAELLFCMLRSGH